MLAWDMIMVCVTFMSLNFIPQYQFGYLKNPYVNISSDSQIFSIQWPICSNKDQVDHTDLDSCHRSWPFENMNSWLHDNISNFLNCSIEGLEVSNPIEMEFRLVETQRGVFCSLLDLEFENNLNYTICYLDHPNFDFNCDSTRGNHYITFWLAFVTVLILEVRIISFVWFTRKCAKN